MSRSRKVYERVMCADGFSMSVQAGEHLYCRPRINGASSYNTVEVGFPWMPEPLLGPYADAYKDEDPRKIVYGYVPVELVSRIIAIHGGMVQGEVPPGVNPVWAIEKPICNSGENHES